MFQGESSIGSLISHTHHVTTHQHKTAFSKDDNINIMCCCFSTKYCEIGKENRRNNQEKK